MSNRKQLTGYPSIDLPQSRQASFFEKNPIIPSVDIITLLKLLSRKNRNLPAIDCNNLHATYQALIDDSHMLSLAFRCLGVQKGDIVTISLPSNYQAIVSFLALNKLGAVVTFIDTYCGEDEVLAYLKKYRSPLFINYDRAEADNLRILEKSPVKHVVTLSKALADSRDFKQIPITGTGNTTDFHSLGLLAGMQKNRPHLPNKGSDAALILYTSGSTGQPKAVVLTNKNIIAAQMYAGNTSHTENITGTKTMTCVPLRYPYGMVTSLLTSLLWGKEAIMTPDWDSKTVEYYYGKKPNIVFGSPAVLALTLKFLPEEFDLSQISHFISGGDFLTLEHAQRAYAFFEKHNNSVIELGNGCGNAETVSIGSTPVGVPLKQSTAGKLLVGTTPLIIDPSIPDDAPIPDPDNLRERKYGETGELCLSGEYIFREYLGEPEKTTCAKFCRKGKTFFRTGTLGFVDEDGYFTPTDRKSRFYIRSTGHKVYMDNVQRLVAASDSRIVDCAVVKVPDEMELFVNSAFIVCEDRQAKSEDVKQAILKKLHDPILTNGKSEQLKEYEIPRYIEFVDSLPRNPGCEKIDYANLENWASHHI